MEEKPRVWVITQNNGTFNSLNEKSESDEYSLVRASENDMFGALQDTAGSIIFDGDINPAVYHALRRDEHYKHISIIILRGGLSILSAVDEHIIDGFVDISKPELTGDIRNIIQITYFRKEMLKLLKKFPDLLKINANEINKIPLDILFEYHKGTLKHSEGVADLSYKIAESIDYPYPALIKVAGYLHDIGKAGLPLAIWGKEGPLSTEGELEKVWHPIMGANTLNSLGLDAIAKIVRHHHEHYTGSGYPGGLKDQDIPLESRIISAADAYDAMTSEYRLYGTRKTKDEAMQELHKLKKIQFDPYIIDAFLEILEKEQ